VIELTLNLPQAALEAIAELVSAHFPERPPSSDWPEWMSVETTARYLDVTEERIRKLKDRREIPYYQDGPGCRVFFRRAELDDWMATFRRAARR
jgi:excisionase family DNA binding protein